MKDITFYIFMGLIMFLLIIHLFHLTRIDNVPANVYEKIEEDTSTIYTNQGSWIYFAGLPNYEDIETDDYFNVYTRQGELWERVQMDGIIDISRQGGVIALLTNEGEIKITSDFGGSFMTVPIPDKSKVFKSIEIIDDTIILDGEFSITIFKGENLFYNDNDMSNTIIRYNQKLKGRNALGRKLVWRQGVRTTIKEV